ncbi:MAG: hypothetical protein FJ125_01335 [Deltaproteobacteria bacterium]|nr:hypothetical protein [Deltaproteobacteria bacterium]
MAAKPSERWLTPVVITIVGFLTGFFFVYLLRGSEPLPEEEAASVASAAPSPAASTGAEVDRHGTSPAMPGPVDAPAGATEGAASPSPPVAPPVADPAATSPGGPPAAAADEMPAAGRQAGGSRTEEQTAALLGKRCNIDFGDVSAVVVRQGELKHGMEVVWKQDIAGRPRAGRISGDENAVVVPLAFGYSPSGGRPTAAYIRVESGSRVFDGVMPLKIKDRYLELRPVEAKSGTGPQH